MNIKQTIFISAFGVIQTIPAQAVDWVITPGVEVAGTYLDNVTLVENNKLDDFIVELNPSIDISRVSRGLTVLANYKMQNTFYADESSFNDTYHNFTGYLSANLVKDIFFVDINGTYGQQNANSRGPLSTGNLAVTGNRTNVGAARIKPYINYNFKRFANLNTGVELGTVRYDSGINNSKLTRYNFDLTSGPKFNRFGWSGNFYRNEINYDQRPDSVLQQYSGTLSYQITRKINLLATGGYDDNAFSTGPTVNSGLSGSFWTAGAQWTPSSQTFIEAKIGERYFGNTGSFLFTKQGRRSNISVSYLEDITVSSNNQFGLNLAPTTDQFGNPVTTPALPVTGTPGLPASDAGSDISNPSISSEFYIRKRFQAGVQFNTAKTTLSMNAYSEDRDYQISDTTEKVKGVTGSVNWRISSRTTGILTANYLNREFRGGVREDDIYIYTVYLTHLLSKNLTGLIGYGYNERESSIPGNIYVQNAVRASIQWTYR